MGWNLGTIRKPERAQGWPDMGRYRIRDIMQKVQRQGKLYGSGKVVKVYRHLRLSGIFELIMVRMRGIFLTPSIP